MSGASFIGIDLTSSCHRRSGCAGLDQAGRQSFLKYPRADAEIIALADGHQPAVIAIDSPLGLPRGLCCLEASCACQPTSPLKGRACERELARMGIPSYFTTKRSIIKTMVYRAIRLRQELCARGHDVIEVYPYASKVRLWGKPVPRKTKAEGRRWLHACLSGIIPGFSASVPETAGHDLLDAAIAAYTGYLFKKGLCELVGDLAEERICLPLQSSLR